MRAGDGFDKYKDYEITVEDTEDGKKQIVVRKSAKPNPILDGLWRLAEMPNPAEQVFKQMEARDRQVQAELDEAFERRARGQREALERERRMLDAMERMVAEAR